MKSRYFNLYMGIMAIAMLLFAPAALSAPDEPTANCTVADIFEGPLDRIAGLAIGTAPRIGLTIVLLLFAILAVGGALTRRGPWLMQKAGVILVVLILLGVIWEIAIALGAGGAC